MHTFVCFHVEFQFGMALELQVSKGKFPSLVPRPFPAPVLIACSIKTEGKTWEKESCA